MGFCKRTYGDRIKLLTDGLPTAVDGWEKTSLEDILEDEVADHYYMASQYLETLKKHKVREKARGNGYGYAVVYEEGNKRSIANTLLATGGSGKERNLIRQHKPGVSGKLLDSKRSAINNEDIRTMTPVEWGRLQGFIDYAFVDSAGRDHFSFPEGMSNAQKYKQFGNSVTIQVIEQMAKFMTSCFEILEGRQPDHD